MGCEGEVVVYDERGARAVGRGLISESVGEKCAKNPRFLSESQPCLPREAVIVSELGQHLDELQVGFSIAEMEAL